MRRLSSGFNGAAGAVAAGVARVVELLLVEELPPHAVAAVASTRTPTAQHAFDHLTWRIPKWSTLLVRSYLEIAAPRSAIASTCNDAREKRGLPANMETNQNSARL